MEFQVEVFSHKRQIKVNSLQTSINDGYCNQRVLKLLAGEDEALLVVRDAGVGIGGDGVPIVC